MTCPPEGLEARGVVRRATGSSDSRTEMHGIDQAGRDGSETTLVERRLDGEAHGAATSAFGLDESAQVIDGVATALGSEGINKGTGETYRRTPDTKGPPGPDDVPREAEMTMIDATTGDRGHGDSVVGRGEAASTVASLRPRGPEGPKGTNQGNPSTMPPPLIDSTTRRSVKEPLRHGRAGTEVTEGVKGRNGMRAARVSQQPLTLSNTFQTLSPMIEGKDANGDEGDEVPELRDASDSGSDSEDDPDDADCTAKVGGRGNARLLGEKPEWSRRRRRGVSAPLLLTLASSSIGSGGREE